MRTRRLLLSWIGHADLSAMADDKGDDARRVLESVDVRVKPGEKPGPVKTAVNAGTFDEVHLLSNYPKTVNDLFQKWIGGKTTVHSGKLDDPSDYSGIFSFVDDRLARITPRENNAAFERSILLSPGTPAMAVVWVLLGTSRYPAKFYQTYRGKLNEAKMPTNLFEVIVPELIRVRDQSFQSLAARSPQEVPGFEAILGNSHAIRYAVGRAQKAAVRDVPVMILGESGTGKEMFAEAIHRASHRRAGPFCAINCAAIPKDLLEDELFGHDQGSFTGAVKAKAGLLAQADKGTLFLDEVGECDLLIQAKLLRVLQPPADKGPCFRVFRPIGATKDQVSDVRIIAATNRDLQQRIKVGLFRDDLYYRLATITLQLPALRDRAEDIPILVKGFLAKINSEFEQQDKTYSHKEISPAAMKLVKQYPWTGNVRQLYNAMVQAAVMADGDVLQPNDFDAALSSSLVPSGDLLEQPLGGGFSLEELLNSIEHHYLRRAMKEANEKVTKAAALLGFEHYQTMQNRLKHFNEKT